jgi:Uma2 family endonuclease
MPEQGLLTYADLAAFPDDGLRRELLEGELLVSPSPRTRHQVISWRLTALIAQHLDAHGGGSAFAAPLDVVLDEHTVVEPDLFFVASDREGIITETNIQGAPSLVIEILSQPRIDRVRKRDIYARFAVPEYWIVDPDADRVEVHRLRGEGYAKPEIIEPGEVLTTPLLAGLEIDVAALFRR